MAVETSAKIKQPEVEVKPLAKSSDLINVVNITTDVVPNGWTLNLVNGPIKPDEHGVATLSELQNMSSYLREA